MHAPVGAGVKATAADGGAATKAFQRAAYADVAAQLVDTGQARIGLKALTLTTEPFIAATQPVAGVAILPEDTRYIHPLMPRRDAGTDLAVVDYRLTVRADSGGSAAVERDPTATTDKATIDRTVEEFVSDMREFAVLIEDIPNAVMAAAPDLSTLLQTELNRRLSRALDAHVLAAISDASPPSGVTTSDGTVEQLVRAGIVEMQAVGVTPSVVVLAPADAATVDTRVFTDTVNRWPYNLRVFVSPDADEAAPLLLDPVELGILFQGQAAFASDPYTGFKQNTTRLRMEFLGLMVVRDALGAYIASPSS